jgi:hypothetical protein
MAAAPGATLGGGTLGGGLLGAGGLLDGGGALDAGGELGGGPLLGGALGGVVFEGAALDRDSGRTLALFVSGKRMLITSAILSVAVWMPACSLFTS